MRTRPLRQMSYSSGWPAKLGHIVSDMNVPLDSCKLSFRQHHHHQQYTINNWSFWMLR